VKSSVVDKGTVIRIVLKKGILNNE
jgi:hypothetical protein